MMNIKECMFLALSTVLAAPAVLADDPTVGGSLKEVVKFDDHKSTLIEIGGAVIGVVLVVVAIGAVIKMVRKAA